VSRVEGPSGALSVHAELAATELHGRADAELHVDLGQVVLGGLAAQEQLGGDVAVAGPRGYEPRDAQLLRRELIERLT
jgi:hypothetical protein